MGEGRQVFLRALCEAQKPCDKPCVIFPLPFSQLTAEPQGSQMTYPSSHNQWRQSPGQPHYGVGGERGGRVHSLTADALK
jgi:hypothetical protein